MAHVNLLPWREQQRQHQKQQYLMALVAVAAIMGFRGLQSRGGQYTRGPAKSREPRSPPNVTVKPEL